MLERSATAFHAQCDFCSDSFDTDEGEFVDAVDTIKKQGWRVFKKGAEWFHKCGCCLAEEAGKDFDVVV